MDENPGVNCTLRLVLGWVTFWQIMARDITTINMKVGKIADKGIDFSLITIDLNDIYLNSTIITHIKEIYYANLI